MVEISIEDNNSISKEISRKCSQCFTEKDLSHFSTTQWKLTAKKRKCKECNSKECNSKECNNEEVKNIAVNTSTRKPILAATIMVKNEELRIRITLESVSKLDALIISDTGSTDNTIEIIKNFSKEHNIKLYIKDDYVSPTKLFHYDHARNYLLDYADDKADYILLLDCNDELRNYEGLRNFVNDYKGPEEVFHICQEWWNGLSVDKYYNLRLIKTKNNWRYKDPIHEYLSCEKSEKFSKEIEEYKKLQKEGKAGTPPTQTSLVGRLNCFTIYQDRTSDDDKSLKRFPRDRDILFEQHALEPENSRCVFYLAQTYSCLSDHENGYKYYKKRLHYDGFLEEKYHAYFRCGELSKALGHSWEESQAWYLKAFEFSAEIFSNPRAEPIYRIAEHYRDNGKWQLSFMYLRRCCELNYPEDAVLFVDRRIYDYMRWYMLGIVCYYTKENKDIGKMACINAIKAENKQIDKDNLKFYMEEEEYKNFVNTYEINLNNKKIEELMFSQTDCKQPYENVHEIKEVSVKDILKNKMHVLKNKRKKK